MTVHLIKATFSRGELSPTLHGRVDTEHYAMGLETCENFLVAKQGGIVRRPGTVFVAETKDNDPARLLPFVFSQTQAYALEMGDLYTRFFALDGQVESGGVPYELTSPYSYSESLQIQYAQSADVLYMAQNAHWPQLLTRLAETNWTFEDFEAQDGPFMDENETSTTLTLADRGSIAPVMTSNTTPSGTVTGGGANAYQAFDGDKDTAYTNASQTANVAYQLAGGAQKICNSYWLSSDNTQPARTPTTWVLEGSNDGTTWVPIDRREGEVNWIKSETRFFEFVNKIAYEYHRFTWSAVDGGSDSRFGELGLGEDGDSQTPFNLTASSTTGINDDIGFQSTDVGRTIRIYASDKKWRWCRIVTVVSTTVVTVRLYGFALPNLEPITRWRLSEWYDGAYPKAVGFFEERLGWANNGEKPRTVWLSRSADFDNHGISAPLQDDDAITVTMTAKQVDGVSFLAENQDLAVGTAGSMRIIGPSTSSSAFSATNARQRQQTTDGATAVQPLTIGNTLIYANYYKNRLYEFEYSFELNGYRSVELSILAEHIFKDGIEEVHYQAEPGNVMWIRVGNGTFGTCTYEKNQSIIGMARQVTDGKIEAHCVVPVETEDRLWMIVKRDIGGVEKRYVEYLSLPHDIGDPVEDCVYLDSAMTFEFGSPTSLITGLDHLQGKSVGILADGRDIGNVTVGISIDSPFGTETTLNPGEIILPYGVEATKVTVGLRYTSTAKTLRLEQIGSRDGTGMGRRVNVRSVNVDLLETGALQASAGERFVDLVETDLSEVAETPRDLVTGFRKMEVESRWANKGQITLQTDKAYPAYVRSMVIGIEGEP